MSGWVSLADEETLYYKLWLMVMLEARWLQQIPI
jgi:hypothetical protein